MIASLVEDAAVLMVDKGRGRGRREWESGVVPARKVDRRSISWSIEAKSIILLLLFTF